MRLWSLHPKYLDTMALLAVWREGLLAKHVLGGKTRGYRHHPQLLRFRTSPNPLDAINGYLEAIYREAENRGYNFDRTKFSPSLPEFHIPVTRGQVTYEREHLLMKLSKRSPEVYEKWASLETLEMHPLFTLIEGGIEEWEKV